MILMLNCSYKAHDSNTQFFLELLKAAPCSLRLGTWTKRLFGSPGPLLVLLLLFSRSVVSNSL